MKKIDASRFEIGSIIVNFVNGDRRGIHTTSYQG
eukprot:CAMPEP_0194107522 /NCGR_PEP_ID=MMETSP0150-20130528/7393_1 /TAXON_ID=122233 /ORGANISM="Chaetoceros debilis, Strain MM31A-1" /LENGTH=33 /DNA_ID= /DNA_START= /DNA_END= /DNA_ORIENTATION=